MKLTFCIEYVAAPGEALCVSGSLPALGAGDESRALTLACTDGRHWHGSIEAEAEAFTYYYMLKGGDRVLRREWGFKGFVVSDWMDIEHLHDLHGTASSVEEAFYQSIDAGMDMHMHGPGWVAAVCDLVRSGRISEQRIDDSARRILTYKFRLGLFEHPFADPEKTMQVRLCPEHRRTSLEAARQSIVLLKNEGGLLPLDAKRYRKILVTGINAQDENIMGDWSASQRPENVVTILEGISHCVADSDAEVVYVSQGWDPRNMDPKRVKRAAEVACTADLNIVVAGEYMMRYRWNDRTCGEDTDRSDIGLVGLQEELIRQVAQSGKPTVSFEGYYGLQQADRLPEVMSPEEWFAYNIYVINAIYLNKGGNNSMEIANKYRPTGDQIPSEWLLNPDSETPDWRLNPNISKTNWIDEILRLAPIQSYQLSASGKNDMGSIYFSGGYFNQEGIVKNTGFQRINFRVNASLNLGKHVKVGVSYAPSKSTQRRGESEGKDKVILTALQYPPLMSMDSGTRDLGFDPLYPNNVNPYERLMQVTDNMKATVERVVEQILKEKGYFNTDIRIIQRDDPTQDNHVILDVIVEKHNKIKIDEIVIRGNKEMKEGRLKAAMKKTKEKKEREGKGSGASRRVGVGRCIM